MVGDTGSQSALQHTGTTLMSCGVCFKPLCQARDPSFHRQDVGKYQRGELPEQAMVTSPKPQDSSRRTVSCGLFLKARPCPARRQETASPSG